MSLVFVFILHTTVKHKTFLYKCLFLYIPFCFIWHCPLVDAYMFTYTYVDRHLQEHLSIIPTHARRCNKALYVLWTEGWVDGNYTLTSGNWAAKPPTKQVSVRKPLSWWTPHLMCDPRVSILSHRKRYSTLMWWFHFWLSRGSFHTGAETQYFFQPFNKY